jgi:subtilisin family serine protease
MGRDVREIVRRLVPRDTDDLPLLQWAAELEDEDGAGVRVVLLDSGVAWTHPVFEGAHLNGRDFTGSGGLVDSTGHGTRNAALLVGQDPQRVRGLAPACELRVAKVLPGHGLRGSDEAVARAINWAIDQRADSIIMPLGRGPGSRPVVRAVRRAIQAGCRLYAAAGNRGPEILAFPASMKGVIAVSALNASGEPLEWCCQSQQVGCYAPGEAIWSLGDTPLSGSSPATILAAGVAVLHLARQRRLNTEAQQLWCG